MLVKEQMKFSLFGYCVINHTAKALLLRIVYRNSLIVCVSIKRIGTGWSMPAYENGPHRASCHPLEAAFGQLDKSTSRMLWAESVDSPESRNLIS
jgi:hypothetical protein